MFSKFWAWSAKWGQNGELSFWLAIPATSQRPIFTKYGTTCEAMSPWNVLEGIFKNSPFAGHFPEKIQTEGVKQASYSEQPTAHEMHCREILFTPHCSPRATEFPRSDQVVLYDVWFQISWACHYSMLNVSETIQNRDTVTMEYWSASTQRCNFKWHWAILKDSNIFNDTECCAASLWRDR